MEKDRVQRYAESLNRTIQNNFHYLKKTIEDFQEMCRMVTPERNIPTGILVDIREMYKEIRTRLTEIKVIEQLLQGKYRQYYQRNSMRDKEIMEFGFVAKNCYSKFEYTLMQIEAIKKMKDHPPRTDPSREPLLWFRSKENQIALIKNLRILRELDYEPSPETIGVERREVMGGRTLTLFLFSGDPLSLDHLQSHIRFREHDILERYGQREIHGVLVHLKKVDPRIVEEVFRRMMESSGMKKLKCLLIPVHSDKDLRGDLLHLIHPTLQQMTEGELKTISV
ncbi:MAG: hypothetical protein HXY44_04135 [Syntrophaceae bacterium]|nr:hypothetical protein [Syntrophaceae bacterium]